MKDKNIIVIGGGNTAMDAARTAKRLGGIVTIVYRRTKAEMPARVEELHHALEEGIELKVLRSPREFTSEKSAHVCHAILDVMELGPPDASGRRAPVATGKTETMPVDLVIMALGNASNPIIKDSEPELKTSKWGTISVGSGTQKTSLEGVYSGGDATRGGATAVLAAGDGQAAAREIVGDIPFSEAEIEDLVERASRYTDLGQAPQTILKKVDLAEGIVEMTVKSPLIAKAAQAGQFVRVLPTPKGELIPLTLADWDAKAGTIDLVIQGIGASSIEHQPDGGRRGLLRHRRSARPAEQAAPLRGRPDRRLLRRRPRPAAGLSDHARAPRAREPRHADRRLPHRGRALLDGRGRACRQAAEGVRRPARGDLRQQRRHVRRQGLRHRTRSRSC